MGEKLQKNNKTGITGVYTRGKYDEYVATIGFKGKDYWLGTFERIEEAAASRKEAENALCGDFLEWYNSKERKDKLKNKNKRDHRDWAIKDLTDRTFGKLTAKEPTDQRKQRQVVWRCECACGNKNVYVLAKNLLNGSTRSCGCLRDDSLKERAVTNFTEFQSNNIVEGTRLDFIDSNKLPKNNKTGYKGVYIRKKDGKYVAQIRFQGKSYFLGSYWKLEEAAAARKAAEDKLWGDFLAWYNSPERKDK